MNRGLMKGEEEGERGERREGRERGERGERRGERREEREGGRGREMRERHFQFHFVLVFLPKLLDGKPSVFWQLSDFVACSKYINNLHFER